MADESITWPAPPDVTNATDGAQSYNMGRVFTLTEDAPVVGVEWRVPDALTTPPSGAVYGIALWDETTSDRLAFKAVTPTPGGYQQFLFDEADFHDGLTTETLQVTIYTNHYVYAAGDDAGSTSPSGTIVAGASRLAENNAGAGSAPRPINPTTLNFYVSPIVRLGDGDHTTTGTAPVQATATASVSTARVTARTATVSATATATASTVRTTSGTAAVAMAVAASVATARASAGAVTAVVTATATRSTGRTTTGTAGVRVTGGSYTASGAAGPRLISRRQQGRIVVRKQSVS